MIRKLHPNVPDLLWPVCDEKLLDLCFENKHEQRDLAQAYFNVAPGWLRTAASKTHSILFITDNIKSAWQAELVVYYSMWACSLGLQPPCAHARHVWQKLEQLSVQEWELQVLRERCGLQDTAAFAAWCRPALGPPVWYRTPVEWQVWWCFTVLLCAVLCCC